MKTYLTPLRTNWMEPQPKKYKNRGLNRPISYLEKMNRSLSYRPTGITPRVACVRRAKGGGHKVVGITEIIQGNFAECKVFLKNAGYTGLRMGAIRVIL